MPIYNVSKNNEAAMLEAAAQGMPAGLPEPMKTVFLARFWRDGVEYGRCACADAFSAHQYIRAYPDYEVMVASGYIPEVVEIPLG